LRAETFTGIAAFGRSRRDFLATFLDLASGIPSHDTFGRVLAVLDPSALQEAFRLWVASLVETAKGEDRGHGRSEHRRCHVCHDLSAITRRSDWARLGSVVMVEVDRTVGDKTSTEQRFYISSQKGLRAKTALSTIRSHWGIENSLHWVLDVAFREDDCRVRAGNAAENFAVLRHFTMNLLKNAPSKLGIKTRRLQAGWDHEFLLRTLCG